ncbi:MAG: serine/threonine-protein kinase [Planctomycetaceae bacterium]
MIENHLRCDDQLLQAMLREELPAEAGDDLIAHVESCPRCQQRVTELAGSTADWMRMTEAMSDSPERKLDSFALDFSELGQKTIHWTESMARQLLSPATHPEMMGRLGRYEIERLIGSGGMGVVFKAHDSELNRPVAIKLLAPYLASSGPARKRFSREARAAAAVVHQHVVPIHNVETERDAPFIVMQFVSGESLQDRIDRQGPCELCEILRIGMQVADGLSAAHQQGLVHRDIKPSNILLEEDVDRALISDFGLARAADDATLTRPGFHPGTPQYMSPEQALGQSVDARSDLFSLGSTLYTMCTGRPPFRAENSLSVMRRISDSEPTPIREINPAIPDWMCAIINKLMAKDQLNRIQSAAEVHELLEACLSHVQQPTVSALPRFPGTTPSQSIGPYLASFKGVLLMSVVLSLAVSLAFLTVFDPPERDHGTSASKSTIKAVGHDHGHEPKSNCKSSEQTFEISDSNKSIGKRHLAVEATANNVTVSDESLLTLNVAEIDCIFGRDIQAEYQLHAGVPVLTHIVTSAKDAGDPVIKGTASITNGKAEMEWSLYHERGHKLDTPTLHSSSAMLPEGHILLPETVQAIGPVLLPQDGNISIVWATLDNTPKRSLLKTKTGWRLQRQAIAGGGFELLVIEPKVDKPDMRLQFDSNGMCERIVLAGTTVMTPVKAEVPNPPIEEVPHNHPESIRKAEEATPVTWKSLLGTEPPAGYPADMPILIEGLNRSRGDWGVAVKVLTDEEAAEVEAVMQVQGGFQSKVKEGAFPQWQIAVSWPREKPTNTLLLSVMVLPEPDAVKLMLIPQYVVDGKPLPGKNKTYNGVWDATTSTVKWTPQQIDLITKGKEGVVITGDDARKDHPDSFEMTVNPNGDLRWSDYRHNDSHVVSGMSAVRIGKPFVEKQPSLEKLPNGFKVFFAGRTEVRIVTGTGESLIGPRVDAIGCDGDLIYGRIIKYEHVPENSDTPGYFWIDSKSGQTSKGLELSAWRDVLKSKGVTEPRLVAPEEVNERY